MLQKPSTTVPAQVPQQKPSNTSTITDLGKTENNNFPDYALTWQWRGKEHRSCLLSHVSGSGVYFFLTFLLQLSSARLKASCVSDRTVVLSPQVFGLEVLDHEHTFHGPVPEVVLQLSANTQTRIFKTHHTKIYVSRAFLCGDLLSSVLSPSLSSFKIDW